MLTMKYPFYFINWLNNAIIKLNFIIIWYCFVIFGYILALFDIILISHSSKNTISLEKTIIAPPFSKTPCVTHWNFLPQFGQNSLEDVPSPYFLLNSVTTEQCELVDRSKVVRAQKVTESLSLGWNLSVWRIKASGEGESLWPCEQLTCWRCWKTCHNNPRQTDL